MIEPLVGPKLLQKIISTFPLGAGSIHGPAHWMRVYENAVRLKEETGADGRVLAYFALFHDSLRENDVVDPGHGVRGGEHARRLRAEGWFDLDAGAFDLLYTACAGHTDGRSEGDPTILTCWDADRLDLWRCGIRPDPNRLCTAPARRPEIIAWAMERSGGPPDGREIKPRS